MNRTTCLEKAKRAITTDRNHTYGEPEDNFKAIANYWSIYLQSKYAIDVELEPVDVAHMMVLLKAARATTGAYHGDNYVAGAGYFALGGEMGGHL